MAMSRDRSLRKIKVNLKKREGLKASLFKIQIHGTVTISIFEMYYRYYY